MKLATTTTIATLALSAAGALAQCGPPSLRPPVGGGCPQGWQASGRYCTPLRARPGRDCETAERRLPLRLDGVGLLLLAQRRLAAGLERVGQP
jgi:hypothetical protein